MNDFAILVDAGTDLPRDFYEKYDIDFIPMTCTMDGRDYTDDAGISLPYKEFYAQMREGKVFKTSMINTEVYGEWFRKYLDAGRDLLAITLSSGISSSYNAARIAADELRGQYPDRKLIVVDGLNASMGGGLVAFYAQKRRAEGMTIEETAEWLEQNKKNIQHLFTVDDLMFLHRGGRVGKGTAVLGTLIGVKPLLDVDPEGRLRSCSKKRGRKGALDGLVNWMGELALSDSFDCVMVSHGDCEEDADYVIKKVTERFKVDQIFKNYIGPTIGSHSGPGTIALFFYGKERV